MHFNDAAGERVYAVQLFGMIENGQTILATQPPNNQVCLMDVATRKWLIYETAQV
jgi:hypothetical protein